MKILAIETSCDETGIALLEAAGGLRAPKFSVLENFVSSQIAIHRPFGGVVPNLAKREHLKNLPILFNKLLMKRGDVTRFMKTIDLITVTVGPGLEPALWTGIEFAKTLSTAYEKPLVGANHLEGHLYSFLLPAMAAAKLKTKRRAGDPMMSAGDVKKIFPATALIVSGGHTILLRVESFAKWRRLGETRDDAAGEAFDKVARLLDLPYPGGPEVERLARDGRPDAITFPRPMLHDKNYDFSFSGLKTAVLYYMRDHAAASGGKAGAVNGSKATAAQKRDVAAAFQAAAFDVLVAKTVRAARESDARAVILCGGVAANRALRKRLEDAAEKLGVKFFVPEFKYNLDNAAMIGAAGYMAHLRKKKYPLRANGGLEI